ncbi:hypothetical protein TNCT_651261 [Trichonephila clavata]|uniref:Uncharacterized protein n=1 Tax=Trichonephila clavata TaxID=2740835 RepID=A0A8X6LGI3_TRICU|nr:hypothetical protein TNCT_651261 [Trichonephila clavata]
MMIIVVEEHGQRSRQHDMFVVAFTVVSSLEFRHERSDSTGTTGEAIAKPVRKSHPSRIVLVCDVIESWTSSLPARGISESVAQ